MSNVIDITGKRFGRLVAIEPTKERKNGSIIWKCKCDCGNIHHVPTRFLNSNEVKSCGCLRNEYYVSLLNNEINNNRIATLGIRDGTMECRLNNTIPKNNTTGVRGVYIRENGKYRAQIAYKGKTYNLGTFETLELAKEARKIAEKEIWGKEV